MNIKPLGNRIVVRRTAVPEEHKSGLIILGREVPAHGTVLAVGPGPRNRDGDRIPIDDIAVGDDVTFDKWAAEARTFEGNLLVLHYDECFLRLRP